MDTIKGIAISGKICSGKETLLQLLKKLAGPRVAGLAFADKLKLYAKYLLVLMARDMETGENRAVRDISVLMRMQLFDNEVPLHVVEEKMAWLASQPHTKEYVKPGLRMFAHSSEFPEEDYGFDNIDQLLWFDCGKPRKMLQEIGTECMRSIRDSVWVDYAFSVAARHPNSFFCVTDCRFPNEVGVAKEKGFLDVRLEASEEIRMLRGMTRDGQDYSKMLEHPSETALDTFPFSVVLKNEGSPEDLERQLLGTPVLESLVMRLRKENAERALEA